MAELSMSHLLARNGYIQAGVSSLSIGVPAKSDNVMTLRLTQHPFAARECHV